MTATKPTIPDLEAAFARALDVAGLAPHGGETIPADGCLHRFRVAADRPGQRTGWAILHGDGIPHGIAGDWRTDERIVWTPDGARLTTTERARLAEVRRQRETERATAAAAAARKARALWDRLPVADAGHAYLAQKQVAPGPCRVTTTDRLVVPVADARTGEVISLQFIRPDGSKRFLAGGRTSGGCCILGELQGDDPVAICEGYATGASVQAATGWPVVIAFYANNLKAVAETICEKFTGLKIIIAADNDADTPDNPGVTKATEAARAVKAWLAIPPVSGDFNDLAVVHGGDAVRAALDTATRPVHGDDPLADLARRAADDPGAPFERAALDALTRLRDDDPAQWQRLRHDLKDAKVRISDLDRALDKRDGRGTDTDAALQGRALDLPDPEPWPEPVDGAALLSDLVSSAIDYLVLPDGGPELLAMWAIHAHCVEAFYHTPRLNIGSPTKGCGKTVALDWIEAVTPRAIRTESVTSAVLFRIIDKYQPTLQVDEVDRYIKKNDELIAAINAGHRRGGQHLRCEGDGNAVRFFRTFAPVALAGIGRLPATITDRSISIQMRRATKEEAARLQPFRADLAEHERDLCRRAARWSADNFDRLAAHDPDIPEWMFNRQADNWRPLFALADVAGGRWPQVAREIARKLTSVGTEEEAGVQILIDIRTLFAEKNTDRLPSEEIVGALVQIEDRPWAEWGRLQHPITKTGLARLLGRFEIGPKNIRLSDGRVPKGYSIDQFAKAFKSYILEAPPRANRYTATTPGFRGVQWHSKRYGRRRRSG